MSNQYDNNVTGILVTVGVVIVFIVWLARKRGALTAFGTAMFMDDKLLRKWGMLGKWGLVLARTITGALIRIPRFCHLLLVGGSGSGKGVSFIIPNLLTYFRGSVVVFDPKGDLYSTTAAKRAAKGNRIVRIAPFNEGTDRLNPLDTILHDSPLIVDSAGALADSLVVRTGMEPDQYWNDKAVQVIKAILVFILLKLKPEERNLNSLQDIASDPQMVAAIADKLREIGGVPARGGSVLKSLFDKSGEVTKEGSGVLSTVARHLAFLDSDAVARSVADSTFEIRDLLKPGVTVYLQIPPSQLEAQKGLLRCWVSTFIREIGTSGSEETSEVLILLDEASALGGLAAIEEALVRGRSAGVRLLLAYQSDSQVKAAFKDKPTLLYDNCSTQIYMKVTSFETAERLSKSLGEWTQVVESDGTNWSSSHSSQPGQGGSTSTSYGGSRNRAQQGRALLRPEEILTLSPDYLIAMVADAAAPILARRIKWYEDPYFTGNVSKHYGSLLAWLLGISDASSLAWLFRRPRVSPRVGMLLAVFAILGVAYLVARDKANETSQFPNLPAPQPIKKDIVQTDTVKVVPDSGASSARGFLGVRLAPLDGRGAALLGMNKPQGALVAEVYPDTPASKAGLRVSDVVLAIDGFSLQDEVECAHLISALPPGKRVGLLLWRQRRLTSVEASVGDRSKALGHP